MSGLALATGAVSCTSLPYEVKGADDFECLSEREVEEYYRSVYDEKAALEELSFIEMGMVLAGPEPVNLRFPNRKYISLELDDHSNTGVAINLSVTDEAAANRISENFVSIVEVAIVVIKSYVKRRIEIPKLKDLKLAALINKELKKKYEWWGNNELSLSTFCPEYR